MNNVSVVIPTRNEGLVDIPELRDRKGKLIRPRYQENISWAVWTLRSVMEDLPDAEYIVVDDASDEPYASLLRDPTDAALGMGELPCPVTLIRNKQNEGVGASRNRGIALAKPENTLLVCDAHVAAVEPGSFKRLTEHAVEDGGFAVAQVQTMIHDSRKHGAHFLFMRDKYIGWQYDPPQPDKQSYPIQVPNGGCYAFTRKVYDYLQLWPTTAGTFGHNPVTKGLMCWFTGTPATMYKDCVIKHRYGGVGYSFSVLSQWANACRVYAIVFDHDTFVHYWAPIFDRVLGNGYAMAVRREKAVATERHKFREKKIHTDVEFFHECLDTPIELLASTYDGENILRVPKVSVIIPAWNEAGHLEATVKSLRTSSKFDHTIYVMDDASDHKYKLKIEPGYGLSKSLEQFVRETAELPAEDVKLGKAVAGNRKGVLYFRMKERMGVAFCRNAGLIQAREHSGPDDVILLSDAHVLFDPGTVRIMTEAAIETDGIVMSTFSNWREDPDQIPMDKRVYGARLVLRKERGLGAAYVRERPDADVSPVNHIIGSVYAMKISIMDKLNGLFDQPPGGFWGCAEAMLTIRAYYAGVPLYVARDAHIRHMLHEGREVPSQGYLARVHFLHSAFFSEETYLKLFRPVIDELGPYISTAEQLDYLIHRRREFLASKRLHTEGEFIAHFLSDLQGAWMECCANERNELMNTQETQDRPTMEVVSKPQPPPASAPEPRYGAPGEPAFAWGEYKCCNQSNAVLLKFDGTNYLMVSAMEMLPGNQAQIRVIGLKGILRCPFCDKYASLADAPLGQPLVGSEFIKHMKQIQGI